MWYWRWAWQHPGRFAWRRSSSTTRHSRQRRCHRGGHTCGRTGSQPQAGISHQSGWAVHLQTEKANKTEYHEITINTKQEFPVPPEWVVWKRNMQFPNPDEVIIRNTHNDTNINNTINIFNIFNMYLYLVFAVSGNSHCQISSKHFYTAIRRRTYIRLLCHWYKRKCLISKTEFRVITSSVPARMSSTPCARIPVWKPWKFCRSTRKALMPLDRSPRTPGSL